MIVIGALSPHPPLLVLDPQPAMLEQVADTDKSLRELAQRLVEAHPQRLIIISPHAPMHPTAVPIYLTARISGNMAQFQRPDVTLDYPIDQEFSRQLAAHCQARGLDTFFLNEENAERYRFPLTMDHGTFVPLHFLHQAGLNVPLVVLGVSGLSNEHQVLLGQVIAELAEQDGTPTALLASGDLSHRLLSSGPYGFDELGPVFDQAICTSLRHNSIQEACAIPTDTISHAGQCGYRPILTLLGALPEAKTTQLSYQGPFGVGYCVAYLTPNSPTAPTPSQDQACTAPEDGCVATQTADTPASAVNPAQALAQQRGEDVRLSIARLAVQEYVTKRQVLELPAPEGELAQPAPTFVTLKINGQLRGCIGTLSATCPNQQREIVQNAISACSRDPRFYPVSAEELPQLQYQIYVLGPLEPVTSRSQLDPQRYGVVVSKGGRRGVLLPHLEGVDTVEQQLGIAARKGGISLDENPELMRFEVITYGE